MEIEAPQAWEGQADLEAAAGTEAGRKVPQVVADGWWAGEGLRDSAGPLLAPDGFLHQSHGPYRQPGTPGSPCLTGRTF